MVNFVSTHLYLMNCSVPRGRRELHHLGGREQDDLDLAAGREVCGVRRRHEDGLPLRLRAHPRRQRGRQHPHRPRALLRPVPGLLQGAGTQLPGQNIPWLTKYLSPPRLARQSTAPRLSAPLSATPNPSCWAWSRTRTRAGRWGSSEYRWFYVPRSMIQGTANNAPEDKSNRGFRLVYNQQPCMSG